MSLQREASINSMDVAKTNKFHLKVTFLSGMGVFLEGYDFTNVASALIYLIPYFNLTAAQTTILSLSTFIGTLIGALLIGRLADMLGRRTMYMLDILMFIVFSLMSAVSWNYEVLAVSRFLLGFAIGADQALSFAIIAEFAPKKSRGKLNGSTWILWTIGSLVTYMISYYLRPFLGQETWRVVFLIGIVPAVAVMIARHSLPESPRWLLSRGRHDEAKDAVNAVQINQLDESHDESVPAPGVNSKTGFLALFQPPQLKRTLYITFMWTCITFNTFGIGYFTPYVLKTLGYTAERSLFGAMIVALFPLIGAVIMTLSVDTVGRRFLAALGFGCLSVINIILALTSKELYFPLIVTLLCLFQLSAWIGPAGLVGVVAPEVFPTNIRTTGIGFAAAMGRVGSIIGILLYPLLLNSIGISNTMYVFFAVSLIGFLAMLVFGVETKGKSLEEIFEGDKVEIKGNSSVTI